MKRLAFAIALVACSDAHAVEFRLWNQPLRVGIVESFYASYHGDLGPGLISETDVNGNPTTNPTANERMVSSIVTGSRSIIEGMTGSPLRSELPRSPRSA